MAYRNIAAFRVIRDPEDNRYYAVAFNHDGEIEAASEILGDEAFAHRIAGDEEELRVRVMDDFNSSRDLGTTLQRDLERRGVDPEDLIVRPPTDEDEA